MTLQIWFSFILASSILCFSPGPTVFLVIGESLNHGKRSVVPLVAGVLLGDVISMSLSFAGLGVLLATSAILFNIFKWVGVMYLFYLGLKAWFSKNKIANTKDISINKLHVLRQAFFVTALNPKGLIFFMAFFPLFVDTQKEILPQMIIIGLTFIFISMISSTIFAMFAGYLRYKIKSVKYQNYFNKISGSMLMGAGAITASIQK